MKPLEAKNSCSEALKVKLMPQSKQVRVLSTYSMDDLLFLLPDWSLIIHGPGDAGGIQQVEEHQTSYNRLL